MQRSISILVVDDVDGEVDERLRFLINGEADGGDAILVLLPLVQFFQAEILHGRNNLQIPADFECSLAINRPLFDHVVWQRGDVDRLHFTVRFHVYLENVPSVVGMRSVHVDVGEIDLRQRDLIGERMPFCAAQQPTATFHLNGAVCFSADERKERFVT